MSGIVIFILFFINVALLAFWVMTKLFLTKVGGPSMLPTYRDGDVLLIRPILFHSKERPKVGDVYIYKHGKQVIKRLVSKLPNHFNENSLCFFEGDNKDHSYDSRHYGPVEWYRVRFKVVKKLFNYKYI